jgi:hypothetical protein
VSEVRSYVSGMSLVLLIGSGLLGSLLYLQWHEDIASHYRLPDQSSKDVEVNQGVKNMPAFMPTPLQSLSEITDRPLFTEGRTPPEKPSENPTAVAASVPLRLKLEGVAITPESKVAVITDLQTNELLRLSQGMSHGNWKVTGVSEESVTIQQGPREITLKLELDQSTASGRPKVPFKLPIRPPARR